MLCAHMSARCLDIDVINYVKDNISSNSESGLGIVSIAHRLSRLHRL